MARLSFSDIPCALVSDMELKSNGVSYTVRTMDELANNYPGAEFFLIIGSDMFLTLDKWLDAGRLLKTVRPAVFSRRDGEERKIAAHAEHLRERFGVDTIFVEHDAIDVSSSQLRRMLRLRAGIDYIAEPAYEYIIMNKLYGAKPDFDWLRVQAYTLLKTRRILHVAGCEAEAVRLAKHWGADVDEAREAAILHDITKQLEHGDQLQLCEKYDIMTDAVEAAEVKLLHAKTGAALARELYGASDAVHDAIEWHTTGRPDMTLLEKIVYIADYIEPTREFENVKELKSLAYADLDAAVAKGLQMSIDDMRARGIIPHQRTEEALSWLLAHTQQVKGDHI
jgi:nicotinate-nucleotide adenylyltransferase